MKTIKKHSKKYKRLLKHFQKQYGDVKELTKVFVNSDGEIYAGEWIDEAGMQHITGGYIEELHETIKFI